MECMGVCLSWAHIFRGGGGGLSTIGIGCWIMGCGGSMW
jgi:hypothetical protein